MNAPAHRLLNPTDRATARRWIVSPRYDLLWFLAPGLIAFAAVAALRAGGVEGGAVSPAVFAIAIVAVDAGHVWSTIFRTYLDPVERARRRWLYLGVPAACWAVGCALHLWSPALFWTVLAYVAVFHFVRQQEGFVKIYRHRMGEREAGDLRWDRACVWAVTLYPVLWWHGNLPRAFDWFVKDDFIAAPAAAIASALPVLTPLFWAFVVVYVGRAAWRAARGAPANPGKHLTLLATALCWHAIILWNDDLAFTVTNVFIHGVPYLGLILCVCRRKQARGGLEHTRLLRRLFAGPIVITAASAALVIAAIAFVEEGLWDHLVWREHDALFGTFWRPALGPIAYAVIVPLLTVPQAAHYVLDGFIWRLDGSNPGLRDDLGF